MQTNKISKWAALLLTFSGMAALPLTVTARNVTTGTWYETGSTYESVSNQAALQVSGNQTVYSGTNLTLSATFNSGNGRFGAFASNQATLTLTGGTVTTSGTGGYGIYANNSATVVLNNVTIETQGASARGVIITNASTLTMTGGTVTTSNGEGVYVSATASAVLDNVTIQSTGDTNNAVRAISGTLTVRNSNITVSGSNSYGLYATSTSSIVLEQVNITGGGIRVGASNLLINGGTINTNNNLSANHSSIHGVMIDASSVAVVNDTVIRTENDRAFGLVVLGSFSTLTVNGGTVTTTGVDSPGAILRSGSNNFMELNNIVINTTGNNSAGIDMGNHSNNAPTTGTHYLTINGGTINAANGAMLAIGKQLSTIDGNPLNIDNFTSIDAVTYVINISGGACLSGTTAIDANTIVSGTDSSGNQQQVDLDTTVIINIADNSELTGDTNIGGSADVTVNLDDSKLTGKLTGSGSSNTNVNLDNSTITGDVNASDDSTIIISGSKGSSITGDINSKDNGTIIIDLDDSKYKGGDINSSGSSNVTISGSNGSTVTGTANSKDDSNITINIDGPGSSWLGDTNQQDDSKIIININNGGRGTGGFNGGDLNVGKDSEFTFDKDSHGNNGKNDGTWNVGDNDVKFDNMNNNGKIVINVDTDSGTPKGSISTDNGSGNGHIVINPGGNGTGNPNDILDGVVKGPGTDGWIWDPIDWGLKELEVTGNPDGSVNVRESGRSSTVSALTIGLIAAQKSSWFTQQNSLLKRMGDLRLNAERTVNISGKDNRDDKDVSAPMPTADALISNIWIRSYGSQYNYGTEVTGRSFKQYVYGVDVGTDHKWTLNADNDLYTGLFVGYGAADTDHRYNGSESNLNNYYAGLYASWLNNSGWYIDATLKAQYSDHELKGYHGGIDYFNAKYNNWSVGGSIELGKKFTFQHDWFIEPQLQANYLHILADDYSVSNGMRLNVSDLNAFQLRAGIVAGKTLKLKNGGALQPYVKISGVEMVSTGGKIKSGYQSQRPNLDGTHAELGAGIIWQLDEHNQLHLDYEASFGDKYDKPWGLTAGYRYQF